jgi:hypothetical protein
MRASTETGHCLHPVYGRKVPKRVDLGGSSLWAVQLDSESRLRDTESRSDIVLFCGQDIIACPPLLQ